MAEQEQNRSEQATPHKQREARRRGHVPRSMDMNALVALTVVWGALYFFGTKAFRAAGESVSRLFNVAGSAVLDTGTSIALFHYLVRLSFDLAIPVMLVAAVAAAAAGMLQSGPVLSAVPLKPDFERLNPITGLRRFFSIRLLVESVRSLLKLAVLGAVLYFFFFDHADAFLQWGMLEPRAMPRALIGWSAALVGAMLLWLAIIALLDIGYSRWDYAQKLRMSRREVKDEVKQREGDPRIRARMCELRREMLKRSTSVKRVKDADVLITNPTHFAVALRYRRGADAAPRVVAKGHAELAAAMVAAARRARVPVIRNPALARALFATTDLEREIPESSYADVARILAAILNAPAHARAGG